MGLVEAELIRLAARSGEQLPTRELVAAYAALHQPQARNSATPRFVDAFEAISERMARDTLYAMYAVTAHNVDEIYAVDSLAPDHETMLPSPEYECGGSGANTAVALAKLGLATGVCGLVGDDSDGKQLRDALQAHTDLDARLVNVAPSSGDGERHASGHSFIFTDVRGQRTIYVRPGVNEHFAQSLDREQLEALGSALSNSLIVHLTSFTGPEERALQSRLIEGLHSDAVVSFTPGALYVERTKHQLHPFVVRMNVLCIYEAHLKTLVDRIGAPMVTTGRDIEVLTVIDRLLAYRAHTSRNPEPLIVLVKRYRPASGIAHPHHAYEYALAASGRSAVEEYVTPDPDKVPILRETHLRYSTGAGDAMAAGLHLALIKGLSLQDGVDLAFVLAMAVSRRLGARTGQPGLEALRTRWPVWFSRACPV
jgi:sugar/nucleoside kinase (ribokinase family)